MEQKNSTEWKYGLAWDKSMETGNEIIDEQHKQLFRLTSDLIESCIAGQNAKLLGEALHFLAKYAVQHFADEEELQLQYNFPDYERHKALHDKFKETVVNFISEYNEAGEAGNVELSGKVYAVIGRWLVIHINGEDAKIGAHIRSLEEELSDDFLFDFTY